ncbi:hypothetical protein SDC9_52166 [bioreactor metagenome]|uniref:Oligosaccharide repeat unit polymerase n=1 Tax=bioreactor metagenome TaxID=1076179 RepID=A0A644WQS2_9ZZZZ
MEAKIFNPGSILRYVSLICVWIISISVILLTKSIIIHIFAFWIFAFWALKIVKFDITHPYFWFASTFSLYNSAYAIIYLIAINRNFIYGYSKENLLYPLLALGVVLIFITPNSITFEDVYVNRKNRNITRRQLSRLIKILIIILCFSTLVFIQILKMRNYGSRSEMSGNREYFYVLSIYFIRYITYLLCLFLLSVGTVSKKTWWLILGCFFVALQFSLFTSERDGLFRFIVVIAFCLYRLNVFTRKHVLVLIPVGILSMVFFTYIKYFFVTGELDVNYINSGNFLYLFLNSDFRDTGSNLQILLNNTWTSGYIGIKSLFFDFISAFLPSRFVFNVNTWFNETFFSGSNWSRAFSLVGEGYVIGGVLGIVLLFIILGCLINYAYRKKEENVISLSVYIFFISVVISSFRGSFSTITSDMLRIPAFSLFVLYVITNGRIKAI